MSSRSRRGPAANDIGLAENHSARLGFEHQLSSSLLTGRMFYSQLYSLTFARASSPRLSLSLILDRTTDQTSEKRSWLGVQINWTFLDDNEIVVFAGNRKKGKICSGGVCVNNLKFFGVEVIVSSKF